MKRLLTLSLLLCLISCQDSELDLKTNPIDSKIIIETREVLEADSRKLTFYCKTEKVYPCLNFPLLTENGIDESSFKFTFTSVAETEICLTAIGPATTILDLGSVSNGQYEIEFNNANLKNKGILNVSDTDISLQFDQKNGIDIVRMNTKRVPDNTYWATIGYHTQSSSDLVDEFIQKFADAGAQFNKQQPGYYFYYEIDDSGEIVADLENSGYYFMRKFIFQYDGDVSKLEELVQVDGKEYKEQLSMRLETYKGEMFYNWGN